MTLKGLKGEVFDQDGNVIDGFHRQRASDELGRFCPREVQHFESDGNAKGVDHPAKHPEALCESLIKTFCPKNGTVLDRFAGSGTTLLAARATGRNYYGIDVMKKYVDLARRRLGADGSQAA